MRLTIRHALVALLALVLLGLGVRAVWVASGLETGWPTLTLNWRDATIGWFLGKYEPVDQREPTDQADFWLRQTERILDAHQHDAEIAMGAALVLDTPSRGFMTCYIRPSDVVPGFGLIPELDEDAIDRALHAFHAKTDQRCLALAARAAELEPDNPRWRRLYALLQFRDDPLSWDRGPRTPAWSEVLKCARHDPENALYDYLAACHLWEESADLEVDLDGWRLEVDDSEQFSLGVKRFEEGLRKRDLHLRCEEASLVARFLGYATMASPADRLAVARSRGGMLQQAQLVRGLSRWQEARARAESELGNKTAAYELARQYLRVVEQYDRCRESPGLESVEHFPPLLAYAALRNVVDAHPEVVSDRERAEIESQYVAARVDARAWMTALQVVGRRQGVQQGFFHNLVALVWGVAQPAAVVLVAVAGAAWLAARWLGTRTPQEKARLGWWRHAVAWLVGYGLTFIVLGLAPAGIISHQAQAWLAGLVGASAAVGLLAWLVRLARRRRFQYSLRALLLLTLGVALLCALSVMLGVDLTDLGGLCAQLHVPARGWGGLDAKTLDRQITAQHGVGTWVILQWGAYQGMYVSVALSLGLVALWERIRLRRAGCGEEGQAGWRACWAATIHCVADSAAAMLVCCLLVYLALTPRVLRSVEAPYQQQLAHARDPKAYWAPFQREFDGILADSDRKEAIRADVKQEMAQEAALEAEREKAELLDDELELDWLEAETDEAPEP